MKIRSLAFVLMLWCVSVVGANASPAQADINVKEVQLPKGVTLNIPGNWTVLSGDSRRSLDDFVGSVIDQSDVVLRGSTLAFAANLQHGSGRTDALMNVRYYPNMGVAQSEVRTASKTFAALLNDSLRSQVTRGTKKVGLSVTEWSGTRRREINGVLTFVTEYKREARSGAGNFRVRLVRVLADDRSFTLTVSHREGQSRLREITDRIITSLQMTGFEASSNPVGAGTASVSSRISETTTDGYDSQTEVPSDDGLVIGLLLSFVVTWGVGLAPPLLIRFVLLDRPLDKWPAVGAVAGLWVFNLLLFTALGSQSRSHAALALVAIVSYYILRRGADSD